VPAGFRRRRVQLLELDDVGRRVLGRRHPEVAGYGSALVVAIDAEVRPWVVDAIESVVDAFNDGDAVDVEELVETLAAEMPSTAAPVVEGAQREAQFRVRLLRDYTAYRAADIARLSGSTAANRSQLAYRWRKEQRVFSVTFRGVRRYLAFQFDETGQPLPVIAHVLEALQGWRDWDVAAWFVTVNGLLDQAQPVSVLHDRPHDVVFAAEEDARRTARLLGGVPAAGS